MRRPRLYKVCVTYEDGWRATSLMPIVGIDAPAKAERQAARSWSGPARCLRDRIWPIPHDPLEVLDGRAVMAPAGAAPPRARRSARWRSSMTKKRALDMFWREQFLRDDEYVGRPTIGACRFAAGRGR